MQDVQIDIFLTAHIDEYGLTCIILFNKVLWFGTSMDHLLVNPNQIQMTVMPVSGDLFDEDGIWILLIKRCSFPSEMTELQYILIQEF